MYTIPSVTSIAAANLRKVVDRSNTFAIAPVMTGLTARTLGHGDSESASDDEITERPGAGAPASGDLLS